MCAAARQARTLISRTRRGRAVKNPPLRGSGSPGYPPGTVHRAGYMLLKVATLARAGAGAQADLLYAHGAGDGEGAGGAGGAAPGPKY